MTDVLNMEYNSFVDLRDDEMLKVDGGIREVVEAMFVTTTGAAGAKAGAAVGAKVGCIGGPVGAAAGAVIGAGVGALVVWLLR